MFRNKNYGRKSFLFLKTFQNWCLYISSTFLFANIGVAKKHTRKNDSLFRVGTLIWIWHYCELYIINSIQPFNAIFIIFYYTVNYNLNLIFLFLIFEVQLISSDKKGILLLFLYNKINSYPILIYIRTYMHSPLFILYKKHFKKIFKKNVSLV
jgi:hypothetical protein